MIVINYRYVLSFILFLSIFLASTFYIFISELHLVRIMVPLVLIIAIFHMDGKLIVPQYIKNILLLLLAYLFYMYAITILNNRGISINDFVNYSFVFLMTVAIFLQFSSDHGTGKALFYAALVFYLTSIGLGYYEYITGWHLPHSRILERPVSEQYVPTTFYTNENDFAAMHFLIFIYLYKYSRSFSSLRVRNIVVLFLPISVFLYMVASSRIVLISIIIWLIFELRFKLLFKIFLSALFITLILMVIFPSMYNKLFVIIENYLVFGVNIASKSTDVRIALYDYGLRSIYESYGLGFGINSSAYYYSGINDSELGVAIDAHSYIIELIINGGLVALLGFISLVGYMTSVLHKKFRVKFLLFVILYVFILFSSSSSLYLWGHYLIFVGYWYVLLNMQKKYWVANEFKLVMPRSEKVYGL